MMSNASDRATTITVALAVAGITLLAGAGYAVSFGMAENLLAGVGLVLAAVLVSFVSPAAGVSAVLFAAPTMYDLHPMPRGDFSLLELAIVTATIGIMARLVVDAVRDGWGTLGDIFTPPQVVVPVGILLAAAALTVVTLAEPAFRSESLREIRTVIVEPLLFLAVARMAMRNPVVRHIAGSMLVVSGTILAGYAIAQIAFDLGGVQSGELTRATATYTHPNNLALYLERSLLVTIGVGVVRPRWWPVWILGIMQLMGVALTVSRGALVAVVAGVAVLFLLRGLYAWLLLLVAGGVGVAGVGAVLFPERFIDAGGAGAEPTRLTIWRASLRMALDHPIFGVGPDQFLYQYSRRYIEPMGWPERWTSHPHNLVLDVWLRLGVAGLAAMASLVIGLVWWVKRHLRAVRGDIWGMGAIAALVGGVAHGMLDNGFFLPDLATLTWFFVALIITVPTAAGSREEERATVESRVAMERTWPEQPVVAGDGSGTSPRWPVPSRASFVAAGMILLFAIAPVVSQNAYIPLIMIGLAGLVTILYPAVGIAGVVASIPLQDAVLVPFVRGDLTITQIVLFGTVLGWAVTISRYRIWLDAVVVGFLAVLAAFSISLVEMDSPGLWFGEGYRWIVAGIFYVICRSVLTSWDRIKVVLYGVMAGVVGSGLYTLYELFEWLRTDQVGGWLQFRALGSFGVPNPLAAYIEITVPPLLVLSLVGFRTSIRERIGLPFWLMTLVASGAGMLTLALTQSRGGFIGMAFAIVVVFLILPGRLQIATVAVGGLLVAGFLLTPIGQSQIERFSQATNDTDGSSVVRHPHQGTWGRESLWLAGLDMTVDKPLTGVGAGEFDYHYREYVRTWVDRPPAGQAHNAWLQMGAQAGIPGIIAFTIWLGASIHSVFGAHRRACDPLARMLAWGAFAALVAFSIHSLVDYLNVLSLSLQISAVTAIGLNLAPTPLVAPGTAAPGPQGIVEAVPVS